MSSATANDLTLPLIGGRNHFLIRRLHSLTGILFGLYVIVHLSVNATLIQGENPNIYQMQVDKIHSLPFLWLVEWTFIYLPILFHSAYGLWITFTGQPNASQYPYGKNVFYLVQRLTAILLIFFIAFHVLGMKGVFGQSSVFTFDPARATETAARHITTYGFISFVVYPLFVLCACFHLTNGFWTAGITWGLTVSAAAQRRWGMACTGLFVLTFAAGMTALVALWAHRGLV